VSESSQKRLIRQKRRELVSAVRSWVRSQKDLWQRVPYLALQADGRSGHLDKFAHAYYHGYWLLDASINNGYYCVSVDLANGELIDPNKPTQKASDDSILVLVADIDALDAVKVVAYLEQASTEPTGRWYDEKEKRAWRESVLKETGLLPLYVRTQHYEPNWGAEL